MKAGDYRGAMSALANRAENMVAAAGDCAARKKRVTTDYTDFTDF